MTRIRSQIKNRKHICDPYFYEHYKEKIQVDKNGREFMLFRINVYFTEYVLAEEIYEEKKHADIDLIFEEKRQKYQNKSW